MTADQLVAKNLEARGGAAKLAALRSMRLTGKLVLGAGERQIQAAWAQVQKRPGMIRTETTLQGLTQVETYDGKDAWTLDPFEGRRDAQRDSADDARIRAREADIEGPLVNWREKGHRVEYMGTEDVDGTPAHKLRVNLKDGDTQYVFLDPDYFLEIRIETISHVRGTERISEADLGSYEQVDGIWMPFSIEAGAKGRPRGARLTIERAEANVDVDDAIFRFPPAGTPIGRAVVAGPVPAGAAAAQVSTPPRSAAGTAAPRFDSATLSGLGARNIGSATMSGRIAAVAARNEGGKTTL
ncbi:MAG TPA: hypothetical protein VIZ69_12390, partial [Thermoanaerobaculia bacterium]